MQTVKKLFYFHPNSDVKTFRLSIFVKVQPLRLKDTKKYEAKIFTKKKEEFIAEEIADASSIE